MQTAAKPHSCNNNTRAREIYFLQQLQQASMQMVSCCKHKALGKSVLSRLARASCNHARERTRAVLCLNARLLTLQKKTRFAVLELYRLSATHSASDER